MPSERMRSWIRKFELSSTAISSRCLAALGWGAPRCPRLQPEPILVEFNDFCFPPPSVRLPGPGEP